ncbi:thiamine pyrophosphate-binding protein, partial [Streptomyces sp. NPDC002553]|uniref:thiamine pyrophosphate-binding protein n=1 Tax=Streptomyces sp. NPDC002553 TaxID=3154417 RepID=UPI003317694B
MGRGCSPASTSSTIRSLPSCHGAYCGPRIPGRSALRRSDLRYVGLRVENNAGFAADAYGRATG